MEKKVILQTKKISKYFYKPVKFKALDEVSFEVYNNLSSIIKTNKFD